MTDKKYYLETNALYSIRTINESHLENSFTSVLAIFELISGIKAINFTKRKSILNYIRVLKLHVDWRMPEEMLFSSFSVLNDFKFTDFRQDALGRLIKLISNSDSIEDVFAADQRDNPKMGLDYFINLDDQYNLNFVSATVTGTKNLKLAFETADHEPLVLNNKAYDFSSHKAMEHLFTTEPSINRGITILAFANRFLTPAVMEAGISEETLYNSYNGYADKFIDVYAARTNHYTIQKTAPQTNDFTDLLHLLYLSDWKGIKIISNDSLYAKICPDLLLPIESLKN